MTTVDARRGDSKEQEGRVAKDSTSNKAAHNSPMASVEAFTGEDKNWSQSMDSRDRTAKFWRRQK